MKARIEFDFNQHCDPPKPYGRLMIGDRVISGVTRDSFDEVERTLLQRSRELAALPKPPPPKEFEVQQPTEGAE